MNELNPRIVFDRMTVEAPDKDGEFEFIVDAERQLEFGDPCEFLNKDEIKDLIKFFQSHLNEVTYTEKVCQNLLSNIKVKELKKELIKINEDVVGEMLTKIKLEEFYMRYQQLFDMFELKELQWNLKIVNNTLLFTPIREIDKYAIKGILDK